MHKGFVFGKFLPFHKGHKALIRFARAQVDFLSVLVCASDQETISGELRKRWIEETFSDCPEIEVLVFPYKESELPNSSESSKEISRVWAEVFKHSFPDHSTVVTSEPYGEYVAEYMGIRHILFDQNRNKIPVSATRIRSDLFACWHFLPDAVKSSMVIKVVILGTESTGKTTLTEKLANHYGATAVYEAGRDLIPDSNEFSIDDLYRVANEHARRIRKAETGDSPLIIIDTDIHITQSYSRFSLHKELIIDRDIYDANKADLYLYLNSDVEFVQDGTRMFEESRNRLDRSHREVLKKHQISIVEISGNWEQRFQKAIQEIDRLIGIKTNRL